MVFTVKLRDARRKIGSVGRKTREKYSLNLGKITIWISPLTFNINNIIIYKYNFKIYKNIYKKLKAKIGVMGFQKPVLLTFRIRCYRLSETGVPNLILGSADCRDI